MKSLCEIFEKAFEYYEKNYCMTEDGEPIVGEDKVSFRYMGSTYDDRHLVQVVVTSSCSDASEVIDIYGEKGSLILELRDGYIPERRQITANGHNLGAMMKAWNRVNNSFMYALGFLNMDGTYSTESPWYKYDGDKGIIIDVESEDC